MTINCRQTLDSFDTDGWAIVEGLLTKNQVVRAKRAVEHALAQPWPVSPWIRPRTYQWHEEHPIFIEIMEHPFAVEFARGWLGGDFHLIAAQCSRNTRDAFYAPGADGLHQDAVFFPRAERREEGVADDRYSFSAMWYLQDTPLEMGPTELVSGSHNAGIDYSGKMYVTVFRQAMPAGSLLLFNHRTFHRGAPNNTALPRDLITNAYARRAVEKVQLTTPQAAGGEMYMPCNPLLDDCSNVLRQLLAEPASVA